MTIAAIGAEEMGSAAGAALIRQGRRAVADLREPSRRSRSLARAAGLEGLASLEAVIGEADLFVRALDGHR